MGTRHFIGFLYPEEKGTVSLRGSYNQFDGYLTGTGKALQKELPEILKIEGLLDKIRAMRWVKDREEPSGEDLEMVIKMGTWNHGVSTGQDWYSCLRKDQGSMLKRIEHGIAVDNREFPKDSLFCECSYILDLTGDVPAMIILEGFNKDPKLQWEFCTLEPAEVADNRGYVGSKKIWDGTVEEYIALDMMAFEKERYDAEFT